MTTFIIRFAAVLSMAVQQPPALRLVQAAPPRPAPEQTAEIGTAIFRLDVDANGVIAGVSRVQGQQWTIQPSRYALDDWKFRSGPGTASATFIYKPRPAVADRQETVRPERSGEAAEEAPIPATIIVPGYPIGGLGQGAVIIQAQVDPSGKVVGTEVIAPVASLTEAAVEAVRAWTFSRGGTAIVTIVFQRPKYAP